MKQTEKYFRTNVLLKSIIGKELINDDNIAILELVKNSYDAGSSVVEISFKNLKSSDDENIKNTYSSLSSKVIIQDYGIGMDDNDIENKWLNIAYSEKKGKNEINGRMLAGAKGVGRFSCDRLGRYLDLYTKKSNKKNIYHLKIDWNNFEIEGEIDLEIQNVPVYLEELSIEEFESTTPYKSFTKGTIIEISNLREKWIEFDNRKKVWNTDKIFKLRKNLEKLLNPNQAFSDKSFQIYLYAEDFKLEDSLVDENRSKINGQINNVIFDKLNFTSTYISSQIDEQGEFIKTTLTDKGRDIFVLKEKNIYSDLKNINIVLYYLNTYSKIYFAKQTGIRSINFGSVFLFINGFRIPPYGDEGDDWLGLGDRKGQGYGRNLGTRELIGRIEVFDTENKFKTVSSREGLIKDKTYFTLTDDFFYLTLRRLERFVVEGLDWDRITKKKKNDETDVDDIDNNLTAKQIVNNFEKAINNNDLDIAIYYEKYLESQSVKDKRILSLIDNIIGGKRENIVDLYINEELIQSLIVEEQKKATNVLQKLIDELKSSSVNEEVIFNAVSQANKINDDLEEILKPILNALGSSIQGSLVANKFNDESNVFNTNTSKLIERINKLNSENLKIEAERDRLEQEKNESDAEIKDLEEKLKVEKQKNVYLMSTRKSLGQETDIFIHNIKISAYSILSGLENLSQSINNNFSINELIKRIGDLKIESEKTLKIAQLITHANFNRNEELQTVNIVEFISQYLQHYSDINDSSDITEKIVFTFDGLDLDYYRKVSVLDLSVVIDNLISNSEKWNANSIHVNFSIANDQLIVVFSDNGNGLSQKFLKSSDSIFDLGVYDSSPNNKLGSSGIGLYAARKLLHDLDAEIKFIGNGLLFSGASFEITFR